MKRFLHSEFFVILMTLVFSVGLAMLFVLLAEQITRGAEVEPMPRLDDSATSQEAVDLGRLLAFDERMSSTRTHSCMTCHLPEKGYSDGLRVSRGATAFTTRNAPTLLETGFKAVHFHDGRANFLEGQANEPIQSQIEMGQQNPNLPFQRLAQIPEYQAMFQKAFGRGVNRGDGLKAIAAFERTLVSRDAPVDRAVTWRFNQARGQWIYDIQPAAEWVFDAPEGRGFKLFFGKAGCANCHQSPSYRIDGDFRNIGLAAATRDNGGRNDNGRSDIRGGGGTLRAFAVPTLREIQATAPYGHAGQFQTLEQVVAFKNASYPDPSRSPMAGPLGLSSQEQADLVAFLKVGFAGKFPRVDKPTLPPDPRGYVHVQEQNDNGGRRGIFRRRR